METYWKLVFGVAVFNDLLDLAGIGAIPVLGDLVDLTSSLILWKLLGTRSTLPTLLEFIPGVDVLPVYTLTVSWAYYQRKDVDLRTGKRNVKVE